MNEGEALASRMLTPRFRIDKALVRVRRLVQLLTRGQAGASIATCAEIIPRFFCSVPLLETTRVCHVWSLSIVSSSVALVRDAALLGIVVGQVRWMPRPIPSSGTRCYLAAG